jgi:ELWxxDGT repeat protein
MTAFDVAHGGELWRSDGTGAGTTLVKDINPGAATSSPGYITAFDGEPFFRAYDSVHGYEPWRSDGSEEGTMLVADLWPGSGSSEASEFTPFDGSLIFSAQSPAAGIELWSTDGTTASLVADLLPGHDSSGPDELTPVGEDLYLSADDGTHGRELWRLTTPTAAPPQTTPTPTPTGPVATRKASIRILSKKLTLDRNGQVKLRLSCDAGSPGGCKGTATLRTKHRVAEKKSGAKRILTLTKASFSIAAGTTETVKLQLPKPHVALLRTDPTARQVMAIATAADATTTQTLTLRPPPARAARQGRHASAGR